DGFRRVVRDERAEEWGLQLVRNECGEVLERFVAPRELDRRSSEALLGRAPSDDRGERGQRRLDVRVREGAVDDEYSGSFEWQVVAHTARRSDGGDELGQAVVARLPPLDAGSFGFMTNSFHHSTHPGGEIVGGREREDDLVLERRRLGDVVWKRKRDDVRCRRHDYAASSSRSGRPVRKSIPRAAACANGW